MPALMLIRPLKSKCYRQHLSSKLHRLLTAPGHQNKETIESQHTTKKSNTSQCVAIIKINFKDQKHNKQKKNNQSNVHIACVYLMFSFVRIIYLCVRRMLMLARVSPRWRWWCRVVKSNSNISERSLWMRHNIKSSRKCQIDLSIKNKNLLSMQSQEITYENWLLREKIKKLNKTLILKNVYSKLLKTLKNNEVQFN